VRCRSRHRCGHLHTHGSDGGGGGSRIVFNVTTPDAASFRKSEGQIAAMLTRAVGRGQRSL
ncbi:MAG: hypothetical protein WA980_02280, partial [Shinella zoogloeoides]|uniref:phage tail tape measure protein n=1 Tax=Shinella zoogloeoides TaxID=352475 RepID=UPI003C715B57